jgi:signal transduction histidine kinase
LRYFIFVNIIISFLLVSTFAQNVNKVDSENSIIYLEGNWNYRWGNSPIDRNGKPIWLKSNAQDTGWQKIKRAELAEEEGKTHLWLQTKLPQQHINGPAILIDYIKDYMEVFVDDSSVYKSGDVNSKEKLPFPGWIWHLIELPDNYTGKILTIHVRCDTHNIGICGEVKFGSNKELFTNLMADNLSDFISTIGFIGVGLVFLCFSFLVKETKSNLGMIITPISLGLFLLSNNPPISLLIINAPLALYYISHLSMYTSAIGFVMLVEETIAVPYKPIFRRIWKLLVIYSVVMMIVDVVFRPAHLTQTLPFYLLLSAFVLVFFWFSIKSIRILKHETRMLLIALNSYAIFVILEIIKYYYDVAYQIGANHSSYLNFGGIFLFLFLGWIIISHYIRMNKQVIASQEEAIKNQQIANEAIQNEKIVKEQFAQNLIRSQEEERKRIAGELHDSLGQELLIIKNRAMLGLESNSDSKIILEHLNEISLLSSQAIGEVRQITYNLRPFQLDRVGLTKALESLVARLETSSEMKFKMFVDNIDNLFPKDYEINIYRMVQEGINNIIKHSKATSVVLMVSKDEKEICINVEDNGQGFLVNKNKTENSGFGLTGINERAHIFGGIVKINSTPGKGTILKIILPITKN